MAKCPCLTPNRALPFCDPGLRVTIAPPLRPTFEEVLDALVKMRVHYGRATPPLRKYQPRHGVARGPHSGMAQKVGARHVAFRASGSEAWFQAGPWSMQLMGLRAGFGAALFRFEGVGEKQEERRVTFVP